MKSFGGLIVDIVDKFTDPSTFFLIVLAAILCISAKDIQLSEQWLKATRFLACCVLVLYVLHQQVIGTLNYPADAFRSVLRGGLGAIIVYQILLILLKGVHLVFRRS